MAKNSDPFAERGHFREAGADVERRAVVKGLVLTLPAVGVFGFGACGGAGDRTPNDGGVGDSDVDGDAAADGRPGDGDIDGDLCASTRHDALGPFYVEGAPERTVIATASEPGERVIVSGLVVGPTCATPVSSALVEVWHADASGVYHEATEEWRLRAAFPTDSEGRYQFETVLPGHYTERPRHYHYRVSAPGLETLITQLYFTADPFLHPNDSCGEGTCDSGDPARIIDLVEQDVGGEMMLVGEFDIVLAET